jgi:MFS family permease
VTCPDCGTKLSDEPFDPERGFRKKKPLAIVMVLLILALAGLFAYLAYFDAALLSLGNPFFVGATLAFLVLFLLLPRARDEKPLGLATLGVLTIAIAFIVYGLVLDYEVQIAIMVAYFRSLFSGGVFSIVEFLGNSLPFFYLLGLLFAFIAFGAVAKGLAQIKGSLPPCPPEVCLAKETESASEAEATIETAAAVVTPPTGVEEAPKRKARAAIVLYSLALFLLACGFAYGYFLFFTGRDRSLFLLLSLLPFPTMALAFAFLFPSRSGKKAFRVLGGAFGFISAVFALAVAGLFAYEAYLRRPASWSSFPSFSPYIGLGLFLLGGLAVLIGAFPARRDLGPKRPSEASSDPEAEPFPQNAASSKSPSSALVGKSRFDGGLLSLIGLNITNFLIILLSLGVCYPFAYCRRIRWRNAHTVIDGYRLHFDGKATQILGRWVSWLFLCLVSVGIYGLWVPCRLNDWKAKHTVLTPEGDGGGD